VSSRISATVQNGHKAPTGNGVLTWVYTVSGVSLTNTYTSNPPLLPSCHVARVHRNLINIYTIPTSKENQSDYVRTESSINPENDSREFLLKNGL
jgi:hypothetical protein